MSVAARQLGACAVLVLGAWAPVTPAAEAAGGYPGGAILPRDSLDAAVFRGGLVFGHYCVTCHGLNADGKGRAARLYNPPPANLRASDKSDGYKEQIIRKGGAALARSEFMPTWEDELTDEQIRDTVAYLRSINASLR